jgi:hypothetical protein
MRRIARTVSDRVKTYIPVRTGKLQSSVRSRVAGDGRSAQILVGRSGRGQPWYANLIEGGTKPHRIPRTGKGYITRLPNGRIVFAKAHTHPGSPAVHFLERGANDSVGGIEQILVELGEQAFGEI